MHQGHRDRLKARLENEGPDAFQPHEMMELCLFYCIARADVNPLAHRLIDAFGSVAGVLHAERERLLQVPGVGEKTCRFLGLLGEMTDHFEGLRLDDHPQLGRLSAAAQYCRRLFAGERLVRAAAFGLNGNGYLLQSRFFALGEGAPPARELVEMVIRCQAQCLLMVQKRERGQTEPSPEDIARARELKELLSSIGVAFLDSLLLSGRSVISLYDRDLLSCAPQAPLLDDAVRETCRNWLEGWNERTDECE